MKLPEFATKINKFLYKKNRNVKKSFRKIISTSLKLYKNIDDSSKQNLKKDKERKRMERERLGEMPQELGTTFEQVVRV